MPPGAPTLMNLIRPSRALATLLVAALSLPWRPALSQEDAERPLPEPRAFLEEVRQRLHSDEYLLDQYTFTESRTEQRFDSKGHVKKLTREVYEVYPSAQPGHTYRKLVERDGKRLSPEELADQDRKHEKKLAKGGEAGEARRLERQAERRQKEEEVVQELFRIYEIAIAGRETIEGRSAILVTFRPRVGVEPSNRTGKALQKFEGRAWVDEEDRQVIRAEAELIETFSYGLGILARLYKGATASFERRKVNGEVWLPSEARFTGRGRLLLLKGLRIDSLSQYSDYKKFDVATESAIEPEKTAQ